MKIWYDSDGRSAGGRKYFAVVEEVMIDKDGKPVYTPTPNNQTEAVINDAETPAQQQLANQYVSDTTDLSDEEVIYVDDDALIDVIGDVSRKMDIIIDFLNKNKREVLQEVVEEEQQEVVTEVIDEEPEEVQVEEPVTEPVAEQVEEQMEEPVVEEQQEVAPVVVPVVEGEDAPKVSRRSPYFAEKMRDASEIIQDRYDELKNYALRFRKLKSRISKKFDSINQGRLQFVKLSVAGKTLKLYLNMDPATTDPKFHCKDVSDRKTYVTVPTLLRIKSGRAVKYAKLLIDQCAEQHEMLERRKIFEVDAMALIDEALAGKEQPEEAVEEEVAVTTDEQ